MKNIFADVSGEVFCNIKRFEKLHLTTDLTYQRGEHSIWAYC